jgi:dimethylhistidine N-methyltransferase
MRERTQESDLARETRAGLTQSPRRLSCRFFYDAEGSRLFEEICALPEYYLTRAEDEILARHAREIVRLVPEGALVVELGSGSARKTQRLLAAAIERSGSTRYVPIDISRAALEDSAGELGALFPELTVEPIEGEYEEIARVLERTSGRPRLVLWLGSNVGNLDRAAAADFVSRLRARLEPRDRLVMGIDRRKSKRVLERAYDDSAGVTARFNFNLLRRINAELGGDFDVERFGHRAFYDEKEGRIEMHLESLEDQVVRIGALDLELEFARGERIHTEDSYKYSDAEMDELARAAGMRVERRFHDDAGLFAVCVLEPA